MFIKTYKQNLRFILLALLMLSIGDISSQNISNQFLTDSVAVGDNMDLYITIQQTETPNISSIDLSALDEMIFESFMPSQNDSLKDKKADISVNNLGLWNDENKDGLLNGSEIKWEKVQLGDTVIYRNKINISFFDVGLYVFLGFDLVENGKPMKTNQSLIISSFIDYKLEVIDSSGLAPIKDIEREGLNIQDFWPILLLILIPLLLIFIIFQWIKYQKNKKKEVVIEEKIIIPPDVIALTQLKELRLKELWQKGSIKEYQSELSHIIREYLEGRYNIKALENTTSQIIRSIKDTSFDSDDKEKLKRILMISDLVKFAKAKPNVNIHEEFMNDAVQFVQKTKGTILQENSEEE